MKKALFVAPFALSLAACGIIPLPSIPIPNAEIPLSSVLATTSNQVVYLNRNALGGASMPSQLRDLTITGDAVYVKKGGTLKSLRLYVRSSLPTTDCKLIGTMAYACPAAGEGSQVIGTVNLNATEPQKFTLRGEALDEAAKKGTGFFGVQIIDGIPVESEIIELRNMRAQPRL
ncbi:hypothetical protein DEDE109153_01300 [Deinococcus deserti]|uniref:Lipoprotein n=1 Tax=Deinococcus deserti (strain DSM 17065 / CIP 109153 / LMG 22923 / VCD115) TaxID=546414 RepID=C1CVI1_DEIDV|nr:hypothetical protein [Deinococcus deserti]ACO46198.1 conserved hypothetical protein, precursor [Deinococcus deserti VCD115]